MQCDHFDADRCRSCALMGVPYAAQLAAKDRRCREALTAHPGIEWYAPHPSAEAGFRNKAKMVVSGTAGAPVLGILDGAGIGVDLRDCGLYPPGLQAAFPVLAAFVSTADLTPYDVAARSGELKNLLVTRSPDGDLMVRFVLRSQEPVARIRKHLPALLDALGSRTVVSVNLLPQHAALVEGDREILLTDRATLRVRINGMDLHLRPQGFFQTNTEVAAALYRTAAAWVDELAPTTLWDLYSGVGGFALHCVRPGRRVTGVETSVEAVAAATATAADLAARGGGEARFVADDATRFALGRTATATGPATGPATGMADAPDVVVVNPPRRGIGADLADWLEASPVRHVLYSSCNVTSLAADLERMPSLEPRRAQLLDMFPQTEHHEVLTLLTRRDRLRRAD